VNRWGGGGSGRMYLTEIGWEIVDLMRLAEDGDRWVAGSCEHSNEPRVD
jgi:hypothetical protein